MRLYSPGERRSTLGVNAEDAYASLLHVQNELPISKSGKGQPAHRDAGTVPHPFGETRNAGRDP